MVTPMQAFAPPTRPAAAATPSQGFARVGAVRPRADDAIAANDDRPTRIDARALERAARVHRARQWQGLSASLQRRLVALALRLWSAWCQAQFARASQRALRDLDDRTLRDIGLTRSEIPSLVAELGGVAESTRIGSQQRRSS
jgi:uncharacterized protein YjiS (DUF1127 family)